MLSNSIGLCPSCKKSIVVCDIKVKDIQGTYSKHYAYVCGKCDTIIGFEVADIKC